MPHTSKLTTICLAMPRMDIVRRGMVWTLCSKIQPGKLGTHSNRKGPETYASRSGCSQDFVKQRGRWHAHNQVVDEYIYPSLPYPDANTVSSLGGPADSCRYKVRDNATGVSHSYMLNVVAPTINQIYGEEMALILAPALLWAAFDNSVAAKSVMPASLRKLIVASSLTFVHIL
jgi:hypothetical protein